jgi:hypothetical protein
MLTGCLTVDRLSEPDVAERIEGEGGCVEVLSLFFPIVRSRKPAIPCGVPCLGGVFCLALQPSDEIVAFSLIHRTSALTVASSPLTSNTDRGAPGVRR